MSIANPPNISEGLEQLAGSVLVYDFGEQSVSGSSTATLASTTVTTGKTLRIKGISAEGNGDATFNLFIGSTKVWQGRLAWTHRTLDAIIDVDAASASSVTLKVDNLDTSSCDFSASFFGYEIG